MADQHESFILRIEETGAGDREFRVTAEFRGGSRTELISDLDARLPADDIEQALAWLDRGFVERDYVRELGQRLYDLLFPASVAGLLREALQSIAPEDILRIVLYVPDSLALIPWELAYDDEDLGFLARADKASLARHFHNLPVPNAAPAHGPLRMLVITASPHGLRPLGEEAETEAIEAAFAGRQNRLLFWWHVLRARFGVGDGSAAVRIDQLVDVTVVAHATRPRLIQAIEAARRDERDFHVVHFAGHGMADASGSYLFLEQEVSQGDQAGEADPVAAGEFAEMIASDTLSVVFLNACQTAAPLSFFQGAAHAMLQRGVGAVVAMQTPVIDSSALAFARAFYGGWAGGQIVEAALASARRQLAGRAANAADWSVPILYMGPTGTWRLSLAVPALRLPLPLRLVWGLLAGFVTLISVLGVLFTVPDLNRRMRTEVPVVRCVWPYPMDEHQFNVAIAPFTEEDAAGNYRSSGLGAQLAAFAYSRFSPLVDTLELGTPYGLRPPYHTCAVAGNTEEARRAAAQTLAEQIHADVLIYGVIEQSPSGRTFTPEFYVSYRGFGQAVDLTGPYRLGRSVPLPEADLRAALEQDSVELIGRQLVPRYEALSKMTVGLAEYVWDNFDVAIAYFESAIETPDWQDRYGKEIAFLFLGNAYARRAAVTRENEDVTRALESYAAALAINDAFARAKIGEASALYQEALGDLAVLRVQNVNVAALNEAESAALAAQSLPAPAEAYVPLKVDMVIGQIDMVRFYIFGGDWIDKAEERFQNVTAAYDQDPLRTAELVGHAYARLGLIAAIRGDLVAAVAGYEQASALVSHHWQVDYLMRIGDLYVATDQLSEAKGYYERALNAATLYGEETLLEEIESKLDALAGA